MELTMKTNIPIKYLCLGVIALGASHSKIASAEPCAELLASLTTAESWRTSLTHANASSTFTKSNPKREADMKIQKTDMEDEIHGRGIYNHSDVPVMGYYPADGVKSVLSRPPQAYGTGIYPEITVSGLGAKGEMPMTLMLPVSGHTGLANALKWAKKDTYTIYIEDAAKKRTDIVVDAKSIDLVTFQELIVPLKKGERITLYYHRSGSGGPGGYIEGRALDIVWDGN